VSLPSGLFCSGLPTKTLYASYLSPIRATYPNPLIVLDFSARLMLGWGVQIMMFVITQSSPGPFYLVSLRPKCSPRYSVLRHPQPFGAELCSFVTRTVVIRTSNGN
jgi:hypothetical protein